MKTARLEKWTLADLPWDRFDAAKVDPDLLAIVKAAALVEYNAADYAAYLRNVFPQDEAFCQAMSGWAREETQHGEALGQWAMRADPSFDFQAASARYSTGYRINVNAQASIRGSRNGELIARCIVEAGTSSYYTAMGDATEEPVLKEICRKITADEYRHYKLFFGYLQRYLDREHMSRWQRLKIGYARVQEAEDDELAFAYFAANAPRDALYNRPVYTAAYMARAYPLYRVNNLERMVAMVFRACGIKLSTMGRKAMMWGMFITLKTKLRQTRRYAAV
jgi:tRNA isopentenyl-2-thiomethyl-A-37 hydroxylase MiaE